jgi:hypothetical protein
MDPEGAKESDAELVTRTMETRESPGYVGLLLKNRYRIQKELGSGGFGSVYLAADEELLSKLVVVKILHGVSADEWSLRKFQQEKEALARIDHPGVVIILDAGQTPRGTPFLVMQFVDGVTLRKLIVPGGMEFRRAADIFRQIGSALQAAHAKGICHRDLKPENIMVQPGADEDRVRLIDFGIAGVRDSAFQSGASTRIAGTIQYMAPEQLEGKFSPETDVYAFGAMAYEVLTGKLAVESARQAMALGTEGLKVKPRDIRPEIPPPVEAAIVKALSFEPEARFHSAHKMGDLLAQALLEEQAVEEPTRVSQPKPAPAPPVQPQPPAPKSRRWLMATGAVLLLGAGLGAYAYFGGSKPTTSGAVTPAPAPRLEYSITVQRYRDGKPYQAAFRLAREVVFEKDDHIALDLHTLQPGYLYVLNEGTLAEGKRSINVLYPSPGETAALGAEQQVQIPAKAWFVFDQQSGAEMLSLVWSAQPLPDLESVKDDKDSVQNGMVVISDPARLARIGGLLKQYRIPESQVRKDENLGRTVLSSRDEIAVHTVQLEHQ